MEAIEPKHQIEEILVQQSEHKKEEVPPAIDPLLLAYLEIFKSVQVVRETVTIQAKEVQANSIAQNHLIGEEALINFKTLSASAIEKMPQEERNAYLQEINTKNQEISALRSNLGNKMTVLKQDAQVSETNISTGLNENQQTMSQGSSLMNMLVSLTQQVARI